MYKCCIILSIYNAIISIEYGKGIPNSCRLKATILLNSSACGSNLDAYLCGEAMATLSQLHGSYSGSTQCCLFREDCSLDHIWLSFKRKENKFHFCFLQTHSVMQKKLYDVRITKQSFPKAQSCSILKYFYNLLSF